MVIYGKVRGELKSDYFRIEIIVTRGHRLEMLWLKSDYFRIEIPQVWNDFESFVRLKSDYFRIEIELLDIH